MTCSFDAERSFNSYARHLAMNSTGVIAPTAARTWTRTGIADGSRVRMTRRRSSMHHSPFPSCSGQQHHRHHAHAGRHRDAPGQRRVGNEHRFNIAQMGIIGSLTRPSPVTIFVYGLQAPNAASR